MVQLWHALLRSSFPPPVALAVALDLMELHDKSKDTESSSNGLLYLLESIMILKQHFLSNPVTSIAGKAIVDAAGCSTLINSFGG